MIDYTTGKWSLGLVCRTRGSVFPRALTWATPSAVMASTIYFVYYEVLGHTGWVQANNISIFWTGFTFVLGFLVVFRTQQAYLRYWEGATLLRQTRGEWFNATSSLIAFCTPERARRREVEEFQHLLVRLMSMLNCAALQTIADMEDDHFDFFDTAGMEKEKLEFLATKHDKNQRVEILIQWVQRLVVENMATGIVNIPAPVITRFFQELSRGAVNMSQARNMTDIPFPFPYAQMLTVMLVLHWALTPLLSALIMRSGTWSALFSFVSVLAFWGTNYIAAEIESPFGDDPNDLPLNRMQEDMNSSLWILLEKATQRPPEFAFDKEEHRQWSTSRVSFSIVGGVPVDIGSPGPQRLGTLSSMRKSQDGPIQMNTTNRWSITNFYMPFVRKLSLGSRVSSESKDRSYPSNVDRASSAPAMLGDSHSEQAMATAASTGCCPPPVSGYGSSSFSSEAESRATRQATPLERVAEPEVIPQLFESERPSSWAEEADEFQHCRHHGDAMEELMQLGRSMEEYVACLCRDAARRQSIRGQRAGQGIPVPEVCPTPRTVPESSRFVVDSVHPVPVSSSARGAGSPRADIPGCRGAVSVEPSGGAQTAAQAEVIVGRVAAAMRAVATARVSDTHTEPRVPPRTRPGAVTSC